jgi:hypothetical protein
MKKLLAAATMAIGGMAQAADITVLATPGVPSRSSRKRSVQAG